MGQLLAYAAHEARMNALEDGASARAHLEAAAKRKGPSAEKARAQLQGPPLPSGLAYLWGWFVELDGLRTWTMDGPAPLSATDILAWATLTDRHPEPREVQALKQLDIVWRNPPKADAVSGGAH